MKQIKDGTNRWRNIPCSWIGRIKIVKMCIPPQAIFRVDAIPIRMPMVFFTDLEQIISRFVWKPKKPRITKAVLRKKNGNVRINLPDLRLYYRATVMTVCIFFSSWLYLASTSAISVELSTCTLTLFSENMEFINLSSSYST